MGAHSGLGNHCSKAPDKKKSRVLAHAGLFPGRGPRSCFDLPRPPGRNPARARHCPRNYFFFLAPFLAAFFFAVFFFAAFFLAAMMSLLCCHYIPPQTRQALPRQLAV